MSTATKKQGVPVWAQKGINDLGVVADGGLGYNAGVLSFWVHEMNFKKLGAVMAFSIYAKDFGKKMKVTGIAGQRIAVLFFG